MVVEVNHLETVVGRLPVEVEGFAKYAIKEICF